MFRHVIGFGAWALQSTRVAGGSLRKLWFAVGRVMDAPSQLLCVCKGHAYGIVEGM